MDDNEKIVQACKLIIEGKYTEAWELLEDDAGLILRVGNILFENNFNQSSLFCYNKAIELNPDYVQAYFEQGRALYKLDRYGEALESISKAIKLYPDQDMNKVSLYHGQGNALCGLGRYEEALESYNKAIDLYPDQNEEKSKLYFRQGNALYELYRYEEALESYNKAIDLYPDQNKEKAELYHGQGNTLCLLNRYEEALESYNKAIDLYPDQDKEKAELYFRQGNALYELYRYEEALESYNKAIDLYPDQNKEKAELYHGQGNTLCLLNRYEEALESYNKAIDLYPDQDKNKAGLYHGQGSALCGLNRYEEALESFNKAIDLYPDQNKEKAKLYHGQGSALCGLNRYEEALESFNQALALDTSFAIFWLSKAQLLAKDYFNDIDNALLCSLNAFIEFLDDVLKNEQFIQFIDFLFELWTEKRYLPMLVYRLCQYFPHLYTSQRYHNVLFRIENDVSKIDLLLNQLQKKHKAPIDTLTYCCILTYLGGDSLAAYDIIDKELESQIRNDLQVQYYFLQTAMAFDSSETKGIKQYAIELAERFLAAPSSDKRQSYYAGQLFLLNQQPNKALQCFTMSSSFLPSTYMKIVCYDSMNNNVEKDKLIRLLLVKDEYDTRFLIQGFMQGWNWDSLRQENFTEHLDSFIHFHEIDTSLLLVYNWIEREVEKEFKFLSKEDTKKPVEALKQEAENSFFEKNSNLRYLKTYWEQPISLFDCLNFHEEEISEFDMRKLLLNETTLSELEDKLIHIVGLTDWEKYISNDWTSNDMALSNLFTYCIISRLNIQSKNYQRKVDISWVNWVLIYLFNKKKINKDTFYKSVIFMETKSKLYGAEEAVIRKVSVGQASDWLEDSFKALMDISGYLSYVLPTPFKIVFEKLKSENQHTKESLIALNYKEFEDNIVEYLLDLSKGTAN